MTYNPAIPNTRMTPDTRADIVMTAMKMASRVKKRDEYANQIQLYFSVNLEAPHTYLRVHLSRVHRPTNKVVFTSYMWDIDTELFGSLMMDEVVEIGTMRAIRDLFEGKNYG